MRRRFVVLTPMLLLLALSCLENDSPVTPFGVEFRLLNTQGEATTTFQEDENIFFEVEIENNSGENHSLLFITPNDSNLIRVYQTLETELALVGSPLEIIAQTNFIHGHPIPANETFLLKIPWSGDGIGKKVPNGWRVDQIINEPLKRGNYYAELTLLLNFRNLF